MPKATAADVVKAAKAKGLKLKPGLVYAVRAAAKAKAGKPKGRPGRKAAGGQVGNGALDRIVRGLAYEHGLMAIEASIQRIREEAKGL